MAKPLQPLFLLEDEPVRDHRQDELQLGPFARIVAGTAVGTEGPFTIGVFADWGQGKTSVLRQAQSLIESEDEFAGVVTVRFNAWQFEREEHPIVPLLASIVEAVEAKRGKAERDKDLAQRIGDKTLDAMKALSRTLRALAYGFSAKAKVKIPGFAEIEAGFVAKEMIDRDEKLAATGTEDPLLLRSLYFKAYEQLEQLGRGDEAGDTAGKPERPKIVVFVDDLDRCMPDQAVHLLESVKLALAHRGFVFVLAVDRQVIEAYLTKRYREDYGIERYADGASYLDKIVQLPLPLPPHEARFDRYIKDLIEKRLKPKDSQAAKMLEGLVALLAIGANFSPRSLVRLINNLLVDLRLRELARTDDSSMGPEEFLGLCAVSRSLQQHLTPEEYEQLVNDQSLCGILREQSRQGLLDILDQTEPWSTGLVPPVPAGRRKTKTPGPPDANEWAVKDTREWVGIRGARRRPLVESLIRKEFLDELFRHPMGELWLRDAHKRRLVNEFLTTQREQPSEESQEDQAAIIERAIRQSLKLPESVPVKPEDRARVTVLEILSSNLTDAGLAHLQSLPRLRDLRLHATRITDAGLAHLGMLSGLQALGLISAQITDAGLPHLQLLTCLQRLDLKDTRITDAGLTHLKSLTTLKALVLNMTLITDAGLAQLVSLTRLARLSLSDTRITDAGLAHLQSLTRLRSLVLGGTQITDSGLVHVGSHTGLRILDLGKTRVTDAGLAHLGSLKSLQSLYLKGTQITDSGLAHLGSLTGLFMLDLEDTPISDKALAHLQSLTNFVDLRLRRTQITDAGLTHLASLTGLQTLDLGNTQITDAGLAHLASLTRLEYLSVAGTRITDSGLAQLSSLTNLRNLVLNRNQITDAGLAHLSSLTSLEWLLVDGTLVTPQGIATLKQHLPQVVT